MNIQSSFPEEDKFSAGKAACLEPTRQAQERVFTVDFPAAAQVSVRDEVISLPTYMPARPSVHPMFLERRAYQGSRDLLTEFRV